MNCILKILKKDEGFALPIVLIALVVLGIILVSLAALAANNTRQVVAQESNLKAHYLARSGIEIAYGALMVTEDSGGTPYGEILFDSFKDGQSNVGNTLEGVITDLEGGTVEIAIFRNDDWLTIHAIGILDGSNGQSELFLDIDIDEPEFIIWRN